MTADLSGAGWEFGRTIKTDVPDKYPDKHRLSDLLRVVADYEACRPELPPHDFAQVRLVVGPVVDSARATRLLGWYLDLVPKFEYVTTDDGIRVPRTMLQPTSFDDSPEQS
jgi:hypothetical protein